MGGYRRGCCCCYCASMFCCCVSKYTYKLWLLVSRLLQWRRRKAKRGVKGGLLSRPSLRLSPLRLSFFLYFCRSALIHITLPLVLPPTRTGRPVTSEEERCHRTWTTKVQVKWQAKTTTTTAAAAADVTAAATTTAIQYVFLGFFGRERIFDELCAPLQRTDPGQPSVQLEVADDAGLASSRWSLLWPHRALKKKNFSVVGWEPASSQRRLRLRGRACTTTIFSCARKGMEEGSGNAPTNSVRRRESKSEWVSECWKSLSRSLRRLLSS